MAWTSSNRRRLSIALGAILALTIVVAVFTSRFSDSALELDVWVLPGQTHSVVIDTPFDTIVSQGGKSLTEQSGWKEEWLDYDDGTGAVQFAKPPWVVKIDPIHRQATKITVKRSLWPP